MKPIEKLMIINTLLLMR